jgi:endoglucanase
MIDRRRLIAGAIAAFSGLHPAFSRESLRYPGVNLAGGEFGQGGRAGWDYVYPSVKQVEYYASRGFKTLRVPFKSSRLFRNGRAYAPDCNALHLVAETASRYGIVVIFDLHEYGIKLDGTVWTESAEDLTAFSKLWKSIAVEFRAHLNVWFGLMNEPHKQIPAVWFKVANSGIAGIREAGLLNPILVMGSRWGTADGWVKAGNAKASEALVDPADRLVIEVHQYLDNTGGKPELASPVRGLGATALKEVTDWARIAGRKLYLGEFGVTADPAYLDEGRALLEYLYSNTDVWIGYGYWSGGLWWAEGRSNYPFSLEPRNLDAPVDRAQMLMLREFL